MIALAKIRNAASQPSIPASSRLPLITVILNAVKDLSGFPRQSGTAKTEQLTSGISNISLWVRGETLKTTFSDAELEFWGTFYQSNSLYSYNILFDTFMQAPAEIAAAMLWKNRYEELDTRQFLPALPRQRHAAALIEAIDRLRGQA